MPSFCGVNGIFSVKIHLFQGGSYAIGVVGAISFCKYGGGGLSKWFHIPKMPLLLDLRSRAPPTHRSGHCGVTAALTIRGRPDVFLVFVNPLLRNLLFPPQIPVVFVISALRAQSLKNVRSRLKISISLEKFNLDLQSSPQKRVLMGGSLEIFLLAWKFQSWGETFNFRNLGPLGRGSPWLPLIQHSIPFFVAVLSGPLNRLNARTISASAPRPL